MLPLIFRQPAAISGLMLAALALGCADTASPLPLGSKDSPLRSPCDASPSLLWELRLSCDPFPPPPTTKNPLYWPGELPCRAVTTLPPDFTETVRSTTFDYEKLNEFPGGTYNEDGNLVRWNPSELLGTSSTEVVFEYADGRYVGASLEGRRYVTNYDGDRRVAEGLADTSTPTYYWVWDGAELVAEGRPVNGGPPTRYEESLLDVRSTVPLIEGTGEGDPIARRTYFYEGGRVRKIGNARAPGTLLERIDLVYDGDRLTSVTLADSDSSDPSSGARRTQYEYSCP